MYGFSKSKLRVMLVGPSVDYVSGSLLRSVNIWYSLKNLKKVEVVYLPIGSVVHLLFYLHVLLGCDVVFVSGVNPWVGAVIVFLRRLVKRPVVMDVHGLAWYESLMTGDSNVLYRILVFVSEFFAYTYSTIIIAASKWLLSMLSKYFRIRRGFVVPNAITLMFEDAVRKLRFYDWTVLRRLMLKKIFEDMSIRVPYDFERLVLLVAPLPYVFRPNEMAYEVLISLSGKLSSNVMIVVTGMPKRILGNIVSVGYLPFLRYVALLLTSDSVIIPYPGNAVCSGVRNKVLEAGYCAKPVIATKTTMLHIDSLPRKHYIPFSDMERLLEKANPELRREVVEGWRDVAVNLHKLVLDSFVYVKFKMRMLQILRLIVRSFKSEG